MSKLFTRLLSPVVLLYIYLMLTAVAQGVYFASGVEPSPGFTLIYSIGYLWIIGWWLCVDSRKHGIAWIYDMGLFLNIAWPFFMPYHLLKTRGAKGLLVIVGFAGVFIGAFGIGAALYLVVAQLNS